MKQSSAFLTRAIWALIFVVCNSVIVHAQVLNASSRITDVTVFRSSARETRAASAEIPKGTTDIILSGVSMHMNDLSLQVSVKGEATLLSASVRVNHLVEGPTSAQEKKMQVMRDSVDLITKDLRWLQEQKALHNEEAALLSELITSAQAKEGFSSADVSAMADFHRARVADLKKKLFDLALREEDWNATKARIESQLQELGATRSETVKEIILQFSAEAPVSLQLKCTYLVGQCGWSPMYDVFVASTSKPVDMAYKARVSQSTGREWKDVAMTISTSNPSINNNRPVMTPKYIDYYTYRMTSSAYTGEATNMMQVQRMDADDAIPVISPAGPEPSGDEVYVEYPLTMRQTIPSNGKEYVISLQEYQVPAVYKYHTVPKLDAGVYLLAKITDYGKYNLLPGQASIFYGDTFIGQVAINPQTTADTLLLSLGRDERIVVKRNRLNVKSSKSILNGAQKDVYEYEIVVRNNKAIPIDIEVLDQVPLTRRKEIEVELLEYTGAEYDKEYGKLLWTMRIPSNTSKSVRLKYTVKYPEGKVVAEQ
ncbi:MAG: DUF4139 domain-containing protein [Flavobacteriales bacterium]